MRMTPGYYWFLSYEDGWVPAQITPAGNIRLTGAHGVSGVVAHVVFVDEHRIGPRIEVPAELQEPRPNLKETSMSIPQPVDGLPSRPGIWKLMNDFPIEILEGIPFVFDFFGDHPEQKFWHPVTSKSGWEWVREFRDGDPRIPRPTKPAPPLPDEPHRHPDGCPKDGLWVFKCSDGTHEFRWVCSRRFGLSVHSTDGKSAMPSSHYDRFLRYVGLPSDFAPAEPQPPAIERCPWCGEESKVSSFVKCSNSKCLACGPSNDSDGAKWNRVARAARGEQP